MAVRIPATGGTPDAPAIPRHSGSAMRKTRNPAVMSDFDGGVVFCLMNEGRNQCKTGRIYIHQCMSDYKFHPIHRGSFVKRCVQLIEPSHRNWLLSQEKPLEFTP